MGRLPKCPICANVVEKNQVSKRLKGKTYHIACYSQQIKEQYSIETIEENPENKSSESLTSYICSIFKIQELTPLMESQIERFGRDNDYTYSGMLMALKYYVEISENDITSHRGIGIIPFIYQEAQGFFARQKENSVGLKDKDVSQFVVYKNLRVASSKEEETNLIDISNL